MKLFFENFLRVVVTKATTNVLEVLFACNYIWFAIVSVLPAGLMQSLLLDYMTSVIGRPLVITLFFTAAVASTIALYRNMFRLRLWLLLLNVILCLLSATTALFISKPPGAGAGFLLILAFLASFSMWKIAVTQSVR